MRVLALLLLCLPAGARAERVCVASCKSTNTSCQQKCGGSDDEGRADCRAGCVRSFLDCRCGCGDVSYCDVQSDPQPGCKLVAQREASAPSGRRPASSSTRTSSAPAGRARPNSRR